MSTRYLWLAAFGVACLLLLLFTCVRDAQARPFHYTTAHAIQIAEHAWGECDGPIHVVKTELPTDVLGRVLWTDSNMCADGDSNNNTIYIAISWKFSWARYCSTLVHEDGHLHGREHSTNPRSIMTPQSDGIWKYCIPKKIRWEYKGALTSTLG